MDDLELKESLIESAINYLKSTDIDNVEQVEIDIELFSNNQTKLIIEITFDEYVNYLNTVAKSSRLD